MKFDAAVAVCKSLNLALPVPTSDSENKMLESFNRDYPVIGYNGEKYVRIWHGNDQSDKSERGRAICVRPAPHLTQPKTILNVEVTNYDSYLKWTDKETEGLAAAVAVCDSHNLEVVAPNTGYEHQKLKSFCNQHNSKSAIPMYKKITLSNRKLSCCGQQSLQ